jgi:hypothetical protein
MAGALTNSASVTGTTNVGPVTATALNNVSAIAVSKTLVSPNPGPAYINSNVVFRIAITNVGVNPISSYLLQDQFSSACFQFLGASIAPSGSGGGLVLWTGLPALAVGASTTIYVTNKVIGDCEPAVNNANISAVFDQAGNPVPDTQSSTSITNLGASISGTLWYDANANGTNDTGDSPLVSAIVYVDLSGDRVRQGNEPFATIDTNGVYQIVSIPAGDYAARVDTNSLPAGVRPTYDLDGTNTPHAVSLTISNGQVIAGLDFGYVGSGSISGYLWSDVSGDGIAQAGEPGLFGVNVYVDLNGNGVREAGEPYIVSGSDGSFAFDYLVATTYRVAIDLLSLPPDMRPTFDLDGTNTPNVATIDLGAGQNVANASFGYQGRASLAGAVTDAVTGLPIAGATVVVVDNLGTTQTVTTGWGGDYNVVSLWTGPATLTFSKPGYLPGTATPTIVGGANTQNYSLTPNTLTGVVTNTVSGLPIAGATVVVVDSANVTNTLTTDATGHYAVTNITAGVATLTASQTGYTTATASPTIVDGANTLNLGLTANTLTGVVTDATTGLPIAGATVQVTDSSSVLHTVTTDAAGHYGVTNLPAGPATLTASQTGYASATSHPTIIPGPNTQDEALTANTLAGIVRDAVSELAIAGATVKVVDSANVTNTITTDATGHYAVTNIAAGVATVTANRTGYTTASATPTIVAGVNIQNLDLTANTLTGLVTDAGTHQPITGATLVVVDGAGTTNTLTTDASGYYGLTNLAAGVATVTVSKTGYTPATVTPTIVAGPNTQDVQLTASTPTLALLSSVRALVADGGVRVRWQTASEVGSISFDLYRQGASRDQWIKINAEPILAANSTAGATYEVLDQGAKPAEAIVYRLVELEEQGTKQVYGPFALRAEAPAPVTAATVLTAQIASKSVKVATLVRVLDSAAQVAAPLSLSALDGSRFVKIVTTNSGVQCVTAASLASLLGQAPASVQAAIAAGSFRLSNQGEPVGYVPNADGSALSFYAEPLKNNFTAQNVYSLTIAAAVPLGSVDGQAPKVGPLSGGSVAAAAYQAGLDLEQDLLAVPTLVQDPNQDYWMWQRLVAGIGMFDTAGFPFALDHLSSGGSAVAQLTVRLMGGSEATHTVQVSLNGTVVGQDTWQGRAAHNTVLEIASALLMEGTNRLTLKALPNATGDTSLWYLNGFGVKYPRQYVAKGGALEFTANSNAVITVDGFAGSAITVLEITDPKQPAEVRRLTISPTAAGYSASFVPANPQSRFVAFLSGAGAPASSVSLGQVTGWSSRANAADYLIITPDSLADAAGTLAAYRQQKGLRTAVARLDQVYNEFSHGIPTPEAIRRLLATALSQWTVKPRYAVLIGDGTYDYRDLLQKHDNLMPPLLVSTGYGLFCSDSAYGDVNGDGLPEIAVGRLPVKNSDQLLGVINKLKSYEALPASAHAQSLLVADAPDSAGNFADALQQVGVTLAGAYSNTVVQCASPSDLGRSRQAIQSSLNAGVDLVDYIGHGAIDRFGSAGYLTTADVAGLQNGARLPVVVAVTCVAGQYSVPGSACLAESLLLQSQGGAIAVVAPTGLSVNQDASRLNLCLMRLLRANAQAGIGDMFRQAMADHIAQDKPATQPAIYNLLGDPATAYNVAPETSSLIAAPRFTTMTTSNGMMVITWSGGKPPYQLEKQSALIPGAPWEPLGAPVTGTSATVPMTGPAGFIRVRCSP